MGILTGCLNQTATHWAWTGMDENSDPSFGSPTEISVRWEDRNEVFTNAQGQQRRSESVVMTDQKVEYGDWLYLGSSTKSDPKSVSGARQVEAVQNATDLGGDDKIYKAML